MKLFICSHPESKKRISYRTSGQEFETRDEQISLRPPDPKTEDVSMYLFLYVFRKKRITSPPSAIKKSLSHLNGSKHAALHHFNIKPGETTGGTGLRAAKCVGEARRGGV